MVCFAAIRAFLKQGLALGHSVVDCLLDVVTAFVLAKELLANEKHSYAEAVSGNVFVVAVARADLLAILNWIAAQRHSRAVSIAELPFVLGETMLDNIDDVDLRKEFVLPALYILFRERHRPAKRVFFR